MASTEQLADFQPFDQLRPEHRALISRTAREVTFEAGATLFQEHQPASGCWLVRSGQIALGSLGYPLSLGLFEIVVSRLQSTRSRLLDLYGNPRER